MKGVRGSVSWQPLYCSMEGWVRPLARVLLALLGLILWGAAAALVFGGAFVILTYKNYKSFFWDCFLLVPGWLAIVSAFLLLPTGAVALCISTRSSRYQQGTFMYLLVVLLCLEASSAVLAHVYSDKMSSELNHTMGHLFHQYNGTYSHHLGSKAVDVIQRQLQCCGVHNYTDWAEAAALQPVHTGNIHAPESCCKKTYSDCTGDMRQSEQLYHEGCLRKLGYRLQFVMGYVFWCCIVVGFLEMLAAISNGILMKHRPFQDFRILDSATFS